MAGSILFGFVPGYLADHVGGYQISYFLIGLISLFAALLQQVVLAKSLRRKGE